MDTEKIHQLIGKTVLKNERSIFYGLLQETIADAYKRLMAPSIEREMRNSLTERAEAEAVKIFAKNTENLLMAPPVKGKKVIAIDPGYRTGCKVAVLDETGKLKAYTTVYPTEPKKDIAGTEAVLKKLVEKFHTDIIVIGNGTGSRETEEVVAGFIKKNGYPIQYTIVNEAGASVYSASKLATEEYPDLDVTTRGAMSLGRRLQDPLAELVKIDPKSIGVGQYQHDINQKLLEGALTGVVEDCVNRVGVDLNTASPSLLSYIAGINMGIAKNIVAQDLADQCEVQLSYAIGLAEPMSVRIETFGTEKVDKNTLNRAIRNSVDMRPAAIIQRFGLTRPIFSNVSCYGHFGSNACLMPWEQTDLTIKL